MKKVVSFVLIIFVALFFYSCKKKKVKTIPQPQKKVEKVEKVEEKVPKLKVEKLSEEEIFQKKTIEELNKEQVLKMIHFDFDKANIREDMVPILERNAEWLKKHPTVKIRIEGYCDERGTVEYNLALGEKRAKAARDYLISLGVEPERITIVSYGKANPIDPRHNEEAWFKNRRAEFIIIAK